MTEMTLGSLLLRRDLIEGRREIYTKMERAQLDKEHDELDYEITQELIK